LPYAIIEIYDGSGNENQGIFLKIGSYNAKTFKKICPIQTHKGKQ
jgi:hypothetical protein